MNTTINNLTLAGHFAVDSGQAIVGDPCYLDQYDTCVGQEWNLDGKEGQYSYQGISATTLSNSFGSINDGSAVAFSTGYGDGYYPVYVQLDSDGRVLKVVIDFEGDLDQDDE